MFLIVFFLASRRIQWKTERKGVILYVYKFFDNLLNFFCKYEKMPFVLIILLSLINVT